MKRKHYISIIIILLLAAITIFILAWHLRQNSPQRVATIANQRITGFNISAENVIIVGEKYAIVQLDESMSRQLNVKLSAGECIFTIGCANVALAEVNEHVMENTQYKLNKCYTTSVHDPQRSEYIELCTTATSGVYAIEQYTSLTGPAGALQHWTMY